MKAAGLAVALLLLFFGSLSAADHGGDITPPVLVAASADRLQIDTSGAAQTITLALAHSLQPAPRPAATAALMTPTKPTSPDLHKWAD